MKKYNITVDTVGPNEPYDEYGMEISAPNHLAAGNQIINNMNMNGGLWFHKFARERVWLAKHNISKITVTEVL